MVFEDAEDMAEDTELATQASQIHPTIIINSDDISSDGDHSDAGFFHCSLSVLHRN